MNYLLRQTMPILLAVLATTVRANTTHTHGANSTFVFNTKEGLQELGIALPAPSKGTDINTELTKDGITLSNTKGGTATRIYNSKGKYSLRIYKKGTLTLKAGGANITKITITGYSASNFGLSTTQGTYNVSGTVGTWTGTESEVTFKVNVNTYINTIEVAINGETPKPTQKVNGLAALKDIADETPVHLYIADADNARVLFAGNDEAFIRDKDCTVCFSGVKAKPAMAYNQHVAGYIVGKKMTQNGMTTLQAVADTHTAFLVIAAPVQESDVEPAVMKAGEHVTHLGDWVTMKDLTMKNGKLEANGQTYMLNNAYGLDGNSFYQQPYEGAIVDLSAIVYPTATGIELRPIYNKVEKTEAHDVEARDFRPLIYVIDEARNFTSPTADIPHATVRLHRTFSPDKWNTLALPFAVTFEGGKLRKYDNVDGQTMKFVEAASVEPGVPYLFKPATVIENPTYTDVTLSKTEARKVMHGSCGFAGTYSPYTMKTDKTERFLGEGNKLYWPDTTTSPDANKMKGLRAYFMVPETMTEAKVSIVGETTAIDNVATDHPTATANAHVYNLNGQFVGIGTAGLPKGVYIVNGKKMVIN